MNSYVPAVEPLSKRLIERDATFVLMKYYPDLLCEPGIFPVLEFFDHILKDEFHLDSGVELLSDGIEGMTWPDGRVLVSEETYEGADRGIGRPRFTIMHECYHGIKHRQQIKKALVDTGELVLYRRQNIEAFRDPEWQANWFAGAILMPREMVIKLSKKTPRQKLSQVIKDRFGVSLKAAEVRIQKLEI
jgi:IrrE N-terminal-like domain